MIKKIINSIFCVILLLCVAITFSACAQVNAMTISNQDGTIDELIIVSLNPNEVVASGYDLLELKLDIETKSKAQAEVMKQKLNEKIFADLLLTFDQETTDILNGYKDGIEVIENAWENNIYKIGIRFKNIDVYKYYYGINDNVKTKTYTEEHFFYDKVYYYASTMYVKHHNLYDSVNEYYSSQYPGLINTETNKLLYTYKTDLRRQHSDADYITRQNGEYYHTWIIDPNNIEEPIMLYYNIANPENWILVGLGVTLIVSVVLIIVAIAINLSKHKNEIKIQEKKDDET